MTDSQKAIALILHRQDGRWIRTDELISELTSGIYGNIYPQVRNWARLHDSTARRQLSRDVQKMNADPDYSQIIITGMRGYKIATEAEAERYLRSEVVEASRKLKRYHALCRKAGIDGQIEISGDVVAVFGD